MAVTVPRGSKSVLDSEASAEMDTNRVHQRIGSGQVGSRVRPTFDRIFLCIIFYHLYSYCCYLIGQDSIDQCVVQY